MSGENGENGEQGDGNNEGNHEQADFIRLLLAEQEDDEADDEVCDYYYIYVIVFVQADLIGNPLRRSYVIVTSLLSIIL